MSLACHDFWCDDGYITKIKRVFEVEVIASKWVIYEEKLACKLCSNDKVDLPLKEISESEVKEICRRRDQTFKSKEDFFRLIGE